MKDLLQNMGDNFTQDEVGIFPSVYQTFTLTRVQNSVRPCSEVVLSFQRLNFIYALYPHHG